MSAHHFVRWDSRRRSGFSLPTIVCLGVCAGLIVFSTSQVLALSASKVTAERLTDKLRASAESGLDWVVSQMANPSTRAGVDADPDSSRVTTIPTENLCNPDFSGTVTVENVGAPAESYLYNDRLDPNAPNSDIADGNGWRVVTASVTNGSRTKSVRVILKPTYGTTAISSEDKVIVDGDPTPFFSDSLFAKGKITLNNNNTETDSFTSKVGATAHGDWGDIAGIQMVDSNTTNVHGAAYATQNSDGTHNFTGKNPTNGVKTLEVPTLPDAPAAPANAVNLGTISVKGNSPMTFPVTAGVHDYIVSSISIAGNGGLVIPSNAGVINLYVQGAGANISITGNGITNLSGIASNLRIWYSGTQEIQIGGNGNMKSVIYAPSANVKFNGNGQMFGAVVGKDINVVGNGKFHYDEALRSPDELYYIPKKEIVTQVVTNAMTVEKFQAVSWMEL